MRLRPVSLLLAPLWLLLALSLLASCTPGTDHGTTGSVGGGTATGGVEATTVAITVVPAVTTVPGIGPGATLPPYPTPEPPTAIPTLASASLSPTELKYRLLDQFPNFFFCDPDYYPIARSDERQLALQRFPALQADQEAFLGILAHLGLSGTTTFTDDQKVQIYQQYKKLNALHLQLAGDKYQFQFTIADQAQQGYSVQGTIDGSGHIVVQQKTPTFATCPICLAVHTRIDTPSGALFVEGIKVGDLVWTLDASGDRVAVPVMQVARVPVAAGHVLVHVVLADGRELWASPGHPTADGRVLADLHPGDSLDGSRVLRADQVAYDGAATYDILPAGPTGYYWADGILMGSTLHP